MDKNPRIVGLGRLELGGSIMKALLSSGWIVFRWAENRDIQDLLIRAIPIQCGEKKMIRTEAKPILALILYLTSYFAPIPNFSENTNLIGINT